MQADFDNTPGTYGRVIVLRHAQASAHASDYDQLSALGYQQAQRLADYWRTAQTRFEHVFVGTMKRHQQTLAPLHASGIASANPEVSDELNEYDFKAVLRAYQLYEPNDPAWRENRPLAALKQALLMWARNQLQADNLESFADFQIRVARAAKRIANTALNSANPVLVVTSGGVMSLLLQRALGFEDETLGRINLAIKNTAVSEFLISRSGWNLQSFNTLAHLAEPQFADWHTRV
jgi:broad specificity phosphatase PhoE